MFRKKLAAAAAAFICVSVAGVGSATAQTQEPVANPTGVVPNFNAETIAPVLREAGYTVEVKTANTGRKFLQISSDIGTIFMRPNCTNQAANTDCIGVQTITNFDGQATAQSIAAFNAAYPFASAGAFSNGNFYLSRYDVADYGIARGNFVIITNVFFQAASRFAQTVIFDPRSTANTISQEGYADDLASRSLNRTMLKNVGGTPPPALPHEAGYEISEPELKAFFDKQDNSFSKISNN